MGGVEYRRRKCKREGALIDVFFDKTGNDELFNGVIATVSRLRIIARLHLSTYGGHGVASSVDIASFSLPGHLYFSREPNDRCSATTDSTLTLVN